MLELRGLTKHFGAVAAVNGATFSVARGECVAMIGPNGAGKSTSFACIAGQFQDFGGQVLWRGECINRWSPQRRMASGMVRTFQVAHIFEALTVLQNIQLLLTAQDGLAVWHPLENLAVPRSLELLDRVGLRSAAAQPAGALPYGARKRLELAMALAGWPQGTSGGMLLLDEPAAGLSSSERSEMMALVRAMTSEAMGAHAVLYTEHNMDAVFGIADRVIVLMDGYVIANGDPAAVAADPTVRARYLGQEFVAGLPHA